MSSRITEGEQDWRVEYRAGFNGDMGSDSWAIRIPKYARGPIVVYDRELAEQIATDHTALRDARGWAVAKEAFRLAEETRARIGDENTKSRGGQTPEYGEAYRASGVASKVLFEAETKLLAALRQPASGDVNWGDMDWEPVTGEATDA